MLWLVPGAFGLVALVGILLAEVGARRRSYLAVVGIVLTAVALVLGVVPAILVDRYYDRAACEEALSSEDWEFLKYEEGFCWALDEGGFKRGYRRE